MCTLLLALRCVENYPLVVAANRDELLSRPWRQPQVRGNRPRVLAPSDEQAGGTWIGVNDCGIVVAMTNRLVGSYDPQRPSRGLLCQGALQYPTRAAAVDWVARQLREHCYNGFNLVVAERQGTTLVSYADETNHTIELTRGVHIVTNRHDLDPDALHPALDSLMRTSSGGKAEITAHLVGLLSDHATYGAEPAHVFCKHHGAYGTSSATQIWIPAANAGPIELSFASGPPCQNDFTTYQLTAAQNGRPRAAHRSE